MSQKKHKGVVLMQPPLEQRSGAIGPPTHSHSILEFTQRELTDTTKSRDHIYRTPETDSMATRGRLRAETGALVQVRQRDPQSLLRDRNKIELILDAKRSQLKKMQQLSRLRFINKFISHAYLDELAADIAWHEALLERATSDLQQSNAMDQVNVKATSSFSPATTGTSN
jgi:hypothetical protein